MKTQVVGDIGMLESVGRNLESARKERFLNKDYAVVTGCCQRAYIAKVFVRAARYDDIVGAPFGKRLSERAIGAWMFNATPTDHRNIETKLLQDARVTHADRAISNHQCALHPKMSPNSLLARAKSSMRPISIQYSRMGNTAVVIFRAMISWNSAGMSSRPFCAARSRTSGFRT